MFRPVNRHIQIDLSVEDPSEPAPTILLPEDFKPQQDKYTAAQVVAVADDVKFKSLLTPKTKVVVDKAMIEEIKFADKSINVVLENYIVGIVS